MFSLYAPNFTHSSKQTIFVVSLDVLTNVINTSFTIMKNHKIKAKGSKFTHISSKLKKKNLLAILNVLPCFGTFCAPGSRTTS